MTHDRIFQMVLSAISTGNLRQDPNRITGADVIGAMGLSDPLGAALYRIYADHDVNAWPRAVRMLTEKITPKAAAGAPVYQRIAHFALMEHVGNACPKCNGTGIRPTDAGVKRTCGACHGSGRASFNVADRRSAIGATKETYPQFESAFKKAHAELSAAEYRVGAGISFQLGKRRHPPS